MSRPLSLPVAMAIDRPDDPARPSGRVSQPWPDPAGNNGAPPVLDLTFNSGTLDTLRAEVRACAAKTDLAEDRAVDMILAVHELAANAVRHGGGEGRLRIWDQAGALHCQVDDGDHAAAGDIAAAGPESAPDHAATNSLPCEPGHGLWVVQQVADRIQSRSGSGGTSVRITFDYESLRLGSGTHGPAAGRLQGCFTDDLPDVVMVGLCGAHECRSPG